MARTHNNDRYSAIQEVRLQMFLDFAEDIHLNRLAQNLGIDRPIGNSDDLFRALTKQTALTRHSTLRVFQDVLELIFGPQKTRVFELAEDLPAGSTKAKLVSTSGLPQVGVFRIDPETSFEETVPYSYVDYLTNEVWFKSFETTIEHRSKQPSSSLVEDVFLGDTSFKVERHDLFPRGAFIGVVGKGGPYEEYLFVASRGTNWGGGNVLHRSGEFQVTQVQEPQVSGEVESVAHKAGEKFEWVQTVSPVGKLFMAVAAGAQAFDVEASDPGMPVEHLFPLEGFQVVLSPGTTRQETVSIRANDQASPASNFEVVHAEVLLTAYTTGFTDTFEVASLLDADNLTQQLTAGTIVDSPLELVLDYGTGNEERIVATRDNTAGPTHTFTIRRAFDAGGDPVANPLLTHASGSTVSLPRAVRYDHPEGSIVLLGQPGVAALRKHTPPTLAGTSLELTRADRFAENVSALFPEVSVIINRGETNEDIVGISAVDRDADDLTLLTDLLHEHHAGEPVRPATIVVDGAGWQIREERHKVNLYIPQIILPPNTLRDASYLHAEGIMAYAEVASSGYATPDLVLPLDTAVTPVESIYEEFPEAGEVLVSDGLSPNDTWAKYASKRMTTLMASTRPFAVVTASTFSSPDVSVTFSMPEYLVDRSTLPNPDEAPFYVSNGTVDVLVHTISVIGTNVVLFGTGPAAPAVGSFLRVRGVRPRDFSLVQEDDAIVLDGISMVAGYASLSTGWVLTDILPPLPPPAATGHDRVLSLLPVGLQLNTQLSANFLAGVSVLRSFPAYTQTVNNVGAVYTPVPLVATAAARGDTYIDVDANWAAAFALVDEVWTGTFTSMVAPASISTVTSPIPHEYVGHMVKSISSGNVRVIASIDTDTEYDDVIMTSSSWLTTLPAPIANSVLKIFKPANVNVVVDPGLDTEEVRTVRAFETSATGYRLHLVGALVYAHTLGAQVVLAGQADGDVTKDLTDDVPVSYLGHHTFDIRRREPQPLTATVLTEPIPGPDALAEAVDLGVNTTYFEVFKGALLPVAPTRFNVILSDGLLNEETVEVTRSGNMLTVTDGNTLSFPHDRFDSVLYPVEEIELADSSNMALDSGQAIVNFGFSNEEIVRYSTNDIATGTLTLSRPFVFKNDHAINEPVDFTSVFSVPGSDGFDYPFYLEPDPYANVRFWLNLVRAAGVNLTFTTTP